MTSAFESFSVSSRLVVQSDCKHPIDCDPKTGCYRLVAMDPMPNLDRALMNCSELVHADQPGGQANDFCAF